MSNITVSEVNYSANVDVNIICLGCNQSYNSFDQVLKHLLDVHNFDFIHFIKTNNLNNYFDKVKLVKYIRKNGLNSLDILDISKDFNNNDLYLEPILKDDNFFNLDDE